MNELFALVDCNNFYASCERVFNPRLKGKPIVVLSNNDGCIVARSNEAKALDIPMGRPAFKLEAVFQRLGVEVFSSNYALYADMSVRVMETVGQFAPRMEVYSIDEAFLDLAGIPEEATAYCRTIRDTVRQWTGIPVSLGIGPTKTLAKAANRIAKRSNEARGVLNITDPSTLEMVLRQIDIEDVWGIGPRGGRKLRAVGIANALELRQADSEPVRRLLGVNGIRSQYELRGIRCFGLEENPPAKKSLIVSRSFGRKIETIEELKEAAATYAARAGEKLREGKQAAGVLSVYVMTSRFERQRPYFNAQTVTFAQPTTDSRELIATVLNCVENLYRPGCRFHKAGVILQELVDCDHIQLGLFDRMDRTRSRRLMETVDRINLRGGSSVFWAAQGIRKAWGLRACRRSPRYTTRWEELPEVSAKGSLEEVPACRFLPEDLHDGTV
jgi:DNA polymerase V